MFKPTDLYKSPRKYQMEAFYDVMEAIDKDKKVILLDLPTGIGKSGINVAVAKNVKDAYYTTPQTQLRDQLVNTKQLKKHMTILRKKSDYKCRYNLKDDKKRSCKYCPSCDDSEISCIYGENKECGYGNALYNAITSNITGLTFARLIIDSFLMHQEVPTYKLNKKGDKRYKRFQDKRELLIVDECQTLESQVATLFAGTRLSYNKYNTKLHIQPLQDLSQKYNAVIKSASRKLGKEETNSNKLNNILIQPLENIIQQQRQRFNNYKKNFTKNSEEWKRSVDISNKLEQEDRKLKRISSAIERKEAWVANRQKNGKLYYTVKPVDVSNFLNNNIWSRGKKIILSSATIPRNPRVWLERIGLSSKDVTHISYDSPFDEEKRQVKKKYVAKMSGGNWKKKWEQIVQAICHIRKRHNKEKGIIHCTSYKQAKKLAESIDGNWLLSDNRHKKTKDMISKWQNNNYQCFATPNGWEGIDLKDDMCHWGIMIKLKLPVPTPRLKAIKETKGNNYYWSWYHIKAGINFTQAIGRGMRGPKDYFTYYVLDSYVEQPSVKNSIPRWVNF